MSKHKRTYEYITIGQVSPRLIHMLRVQDGDKPRITLCGITPRAMQTADPSKTPLYHMCLRCEASRKRREREPRTFMGFPIVQAGERRAT